LSLEPSEYLTANEIAAASIANQDGVFNPQQQFPVSWPAEPVVALAYMDQMQRAKSLPADKAADLRRALDKAAGQLSSGESNKALSDELSALTQGLDHKGLTDTLSAIATRLE